MAVQSSDLRQIKGKLVLWDVRLRATQSLIWLPRGMVGGMALAVILAIVARFRPLLDRTGLIVMGVALPLAGGAVALLAVWLWRRSALANARRFDRIFGLRERISTALELSQGVLPIESDAIARKQVAQAAQIAGRVKPGKHLPLRLDWRWWAGLVALAAALVVALVIPNPQDKVLAQQAAVKAAITQSLTKLEQLKSQALTDPGLTSAQKQATVESLDKAIQTLKQPDVSQQEALAALNNTQQQLKDLSEKSAAEQQQALQGLSGLFSNTAAKDLADALAKGDMQAAGQALQNLDPNNLTPDQQKALAQALQSAAGQLQDSNPQLSQQLGAAGQALQNGNTGEAQKQLGQAGQQMQQQGQQAQGQNGQNGQQGQSGNRARAVSKARTASKVKAASRARAANRVRMDRAVTRTSSSIRTRSASRVRAWPGQAKIRLTSPARVGWPRLRRAALAARSSPASSRIRAAAARVAVRATARRRVVRRTARCRPTTAPATAARNHGTTCSRRSGSAGRAARMSISPARPTPVCRPAWKAISPTTRPAARLCPITRCGRTTLTRSTRRWTAVTFRWACAT